MAADDPSLMNTTVNTTLGKREERNLLYVLPSHWRLDEMLIDRTGTHTVADLLCAGCNAPLGWMYIKAPNGEQRYKEGKLS